MPAAPNPLQHARTVLMLCMANVGVAADAGVRDIATFRQRWAIAREGYGWPEPVDTSAPAAAPAESSPFAPPAASGEYRLRTARTVCASEITRFTQAQASGDAGDILRTFLEDAEPRAQILNDFDTMANGARDPKDAARLMLGACAASVGTLWDLGMRTSGEFQSFWNGRGRARFVIAGHDFKPDAAGCVWIEWDAGATGRGTFRNTCQFTVDIRFCASAAKAGTPSESIACEKGLSRFERLEARGGVPLTLGEGGMRWTQCKAPLQPVQTSAPGASFAAVCK
jgi:hypothetical protein